MNDTPLKVRQLVKTSHFAFFTVVIILAVLLFTNNIVNAQTVSGGNDTGNWSYDDANMQSAIVKYKLYMPENTSFLNQEDSGFPYQMPCYDNDGMAVSFSALPGALSDKNFVDNSYVSPTSFNKNNTSFNIPDSFDFERDTVNTSEFTSANMFVIFLDYHPTYYLVLCNDSSQYVAKNLGAGFFYWGCYDNSSDGIYILTFSEGFNLIDISKPRNGMLFTGAQAFCGNSPIYSYYTENIPSSRPNAPDDWFQFVTSSEPININYLQVGEKEYQDGSGGTPENNLYMRSADWVFNIPLYKKAWLNNHWGEGDIRFQGLLNDYQEDNADKFKLKYEFYIHFYLVIDAPSNLNDRTYDRIYSYSISENLSNFIQNGNVSSFRVGEIFNESSLTSLINELYAFNDSASLEQGDMKQFTWNIECKATLQTNNDSNNSSSGAIVENYNFLNQVSNETENNITKNYNPQKDDDGNVKYDPSKENDNEDDSGITKKDGSIVLYNNDPDNNNQTVTINNGHDEIINTLYEKLVPADSNSNGGLTQRFLDITQSNRWFDLMATAMPYIPMEFWNTMYHLLVVCLGITGIAFLIWIVCHII